MARSRKGISIISLSVLFLGVVAAVFLVQNPQFLSSSAAGGNRVCRQVPRGMYQATASGSGTISWKLSCLGGPNRRGNLNINETIDLGQVSLPKRILAGDRVSGSTTLSNFCSASPIGINKDHSTFCAICKLVDCNNINIAVDVVAEEVQCNQSFYGVSGKGTASLVGKNLLLSNSDRGLINCSIEGGTKGAFRVELSKFVKIIAPGSEEPSRE